MYSHLERDESLTGFLASIKLSTKPFLMHLRNSHCSGIPKPWCMYPMLVD